MILGSLYFWNYSESVNNLNKNISNGKMLKIL